MSALLPTYARSGLSFARGEGAFLFDESGERYLDAWLSLVIDLDNWLHEERSLHERIRLSEERLANAHTLLTAAQQRYGAVVEQA